MNPIPTSKAKVTFRAGGSLARLFAFAWLLLVGLAPAGAALAQQVEFATYFGGVGIDSIRDVAIDAGGFLYIVGGTASVDLPSTPGAYQTSYASGSNNHHDVFIAKFSPQAQLVWCTYLGGPNYDRAYAVEVAANGAVLIAGRAGQGFPTTPGVIQPSFAGDNNPNPAYGLQDGFVARLSPDGATLEWATYVGDGGRSFIRDLALAPDQSPVVALSGTPEAFPHITPAAFQTAIAGGRDGVVVKLSPDARTVTWGSYIGGSDDDWPSPSVRVDGAGAVYVLSDTKSSDFPTTPGAYDRARSGPSDLVLSKILPDGSALAWSTYLGGSAGEFTETHGLEVDSQGVAYVAATTKSSDFPTTPGAYQSSYGGSGGPGTGQFTNYPGDGIVSKISADGSTLLASSFLGGSQGEGIEGIGLIPGSGVVVGGTTYSADFPVTFDAPQLSKGSQNDFFLVEFDPDLAGATLATFVGGNGLDVGRTVAVGSDGRMAVAGASGSTDFPAVNAIQPLLSDVSGDGALMLFAPEPGAGLTSAVALGVLACLRRRRSARSLAKR